MYMWLAHMDTLELTQMQSCALCIHFDKFSQLIKISSVGCGFFERNTYLENPSISATSPIYDCSHCYN